MIIPEAVLTAPCSPAARSRNACDAFFSASAVTAARAAARPWIFGPQVSRSALGVALSVPSVMPASAPSSSAFVTLEMVRFRPIPSPRPSSGVGSSVFNWGLAALDKQPAIRVLTCATEDEATASAAGLWIGGEPCALMIQHAGLYASVNTLRGVAIDGRVPAFYMIGLLSREKEKDPRESRHS